MHRPPRSRSETTVAVIGAPTLLAESLRTALDLEGYATSMVSAHAASTASDVAIFDLDVAPLADTLANLRSLTAGGTQVVVVTSTDERARWAECLASGAARVLRKTTPLDEVLDVVARLRDGLPVMDQSERDALMAEWQDRTRTAHEVEQRFARLDDFEGWVLTRLMAGYAMHEIAREGPLSQTVVNRAVAAIVEKLEVPSWLDAVSLADEHDWSPYGVTG